MTSLLNYSACLNMPSIATYSHNTSLPPHHHNKYHSPPSNTPNPVPSSHPHPAQPSTHSYSHNAHPIPTIPHTHTHPNHQPLPYLPHLTSLGTLITLYPKPPHTPVSREAYPPQISTQLSASSCTTHPLQNANNRYTLECPRFGSLGPAAPAISPWGPFP
jgi:hypothetical protein